MYFPQIPNQQINGYSQQPVPQMYPQNPMYQMGQQQLINPFMYPTKLQPYNDRQFLCKTFNFRVPFIEAFLSLSHEEKLKFFLICESRRLTGELTDKQTYSKVLEKITMIVNPNYRKPQQQQYQEISEEELKKNILEKEFEQKCEWELRKLGMGDEISGFGSSPRSGINNNTTINTANNYQLGSPKSIQPTKEMSSMGGGLSMNFNEFDILGSGYNGQKQQVSVYNTELNKNENLQDQDEFVYQQQVVTKSQGINFNQWGHSPGFTSNNDFQSSITNNKSQLQSPQSQSLFTPQQSLFTTPPYQQPAKPEYSTKQPEQQEWQQAEQVTQNQPLTPQNNYSQQSQPPLPFNTKPQQKVQSIWDLQINEQQLKQSQPDIKQIFGIKSNEEDDFGGFQQGNNVNNNNVSSFLKQNQYRYETIAQVNNDWLFGGNNSSHNPNDQAVQQIHQVNTHTGKTDQVFDIMGAQQQISQSHNTYTQPKWSFDGIQQNQTQPQKTPQLSYSFPIEFNFQTDSNANAQQYQQELSQGFSMPKINNDLGDLSASHEVARQNKQHNEQDQWDQGEQVMVQPHLNTVNDEVTKIIVAAPTQPQQNAYQFNFPTYSNQNQQYTLPMTQFNTLPDSYDPFDTIQFNPAPQLTQLPFMVQNQTNNFSFTPTVQPTIKAQQALKRSSPTVSQKQIKIIRKIIKPPSMKTIEIESSNFNHFSTEKSTVNQQLDIPNLSSVIQPHVQVRPRQLQSPPSYQPQMTQSNAFAKKANLTAVNSLNLNIVPSLNITVSSSTNLPPALTPASLSQQVNSMTASTYIPSAVKSPEARQQKIISTYNKQMTYTPDFFRSSIKTMLSKSKTFFKAFSKQDKKNTDTQARKQQIVEHYSMMDMDFGKNREFLTGSHKVEALYSPKMSSRGFGKSSKGLDYSIDGHMMQELGRDEFDCKDYDRDEMNDSETLNENQSRFNTTAFTKRSSSNRQPTKTMSGEDVIESPIKGSKDDIQEQQARQQILVGLSKSFILRLAQNEISYLDIELKKNKHFFSKHFYLKVKQILTKLSLSQDITHFLSSLSRSQPTLPTLKSQSNLFSTQLTFINQIISKLERIDELNKKFTIAMEDDQEEELAEVVMKSKQLTFQVNQDGEMAKRILVLILEGRVRDSSCGNKSEQQFDEQTDKYYGIYYTFVKLIHQRQPHFKIIPIPAENLTYLKTLYTDASSSASSFSLSSKSQFLYTCTILYLLHTQLNQLQYIKNISQTIFNYLIRQHAILMVKIQQIKELSSKYAESPHSIFNKLMDSTKMTEYLQGLGEIAMVAERLSQVGKRIGVVFDKDEFMYDKLAKTIVEAKQLATKYNLLKNIPTEGNAETQYTPYLGVILSMINASKSPQEISSQMRNLLKDKPLCKVCLAPRRQPDESQGDFISNKVAVSSQSLGSQNSIQWCHYTCYNMLKMAFEDASESLIE